MSELLAVLGAGLVTVALLMAATGLVARRVRRVAVVDVAWGPGFVAVALVSAVVGGALGEGTPWRSWLLAGLVGAWGLRLGWHVRRRAVGQGEDPRYAELLGGTLDEVGVALAVRKVFVVQGLAMWFISVPVQVVAVSEVAWWPVVVAGAVLWGAGYAFETIGDAQLAAYKQIPKDRRPAVMDRGLWAWTRHPNYFGDACVWWGLWLAGGLGSGWVAGLLTVLSPVAMTYFLVFATGARLLERSMMRREGYPEYAARTSMFVPLPPRRR